MSAFSHQPRLWFDRDDVEQARRRLTAGDPTVAAIAALASAQAGRDVEEVWRADAERPGGRPTPVIPLFLTGCAVTHLLSGEPQCAQKAFAVFTRWTEPFPSSDLQLAAMALHGAMLHESCYAAWSGPQQLAMTTRLAAIHERFWRIGPGNPHQVGNNWWAVTHAGAMLAAMSAHDHAIAPAGKRADLRAGIEWARGRLRAFAMHFGDHGLYHEGLGYQAYTLSVLLPAMIASRRFDGVEFAEQFPQLKNMAASLYATACARAPIPDSDPPVQSWGAMLSWNDAGQGWPQSCINSLLIGMAHPRQRGALRVLFDQLSGVNSPTREFAPGAAGWFFHLFYLPHDATGDPNAELPTHICDSRQGLAVFRNRYRDADDAVLGCYARVTHVDGHWHDDAGSVRFMALGHDWILGGGQARPNAEWQSVLTPVPARARDRPECGRVIWDDANRHGGVFGMDLRRVHDAYSERYLAARWPAPGETEPVWLAILDLVDDHRDDRDWAWNLTYAPHLQLRVHDDRRGFDLRATDGANLRARFLGATPDRIEARNMPASRRTFSGGGTVHYPPRPCLQARFARQPHLAVYTVMSAQRIAPPDISWIEHLDVRIGAQTWSRPFGLAVPAGFRLDHSAVLCRHPGGRPWPQQ
jgi:hypothetical protein